MSTANLTTEWIPLHRPAIGDEEVAAVSSLLRSGWLTTGNETRLFEAELATLVGAPYAVAVNSCTAALHLALEAAGVRRGDRVLVPTMTFAATAEVVTHLGATPVLVDCDRQTLNLDIDAAEEIAGLLAEERAVPGVAEPGPARAIIPVHFAGQMVDVDGVARLAARRRLRVIEDAAHALPASARAADGRWRSVGSTAEQTCFSFYANKTVTCGEGGMLVTTNGHIAERARRMSLHGLSRNAWDRFGRSGSWDYLILAAGFKYNLSDIAAALGRVQLRKAYMLAAARARIAARYCAALGDVDELELPYERPDRQSSWHLFVVRLRLEYLDIGRDAFIEELRRAGIGASVHYRPLHLHPYYRETFGYLPEHFPVATAEWRRCISLPIYPTMSDREIERVIATVRACAHAHALKRAMAGASTQ
jgi:perosamine synthetase